MVRCERQSFLVIKRHEQMLKDKEVVFGQVSESVLDNEELLHELSQLQASARDYETILVQGCPKTRDTNAYAEASNGLARIEQIQRRLAL